MNRIFLILLFSVLELMAVEIPTEIATSRTFGKSVQVNAKIVHSFQKFCLLQFL